MNEVQTFHFQDDGETPNNPRLPLVVYRSAVDVSADRDPAVRESLKLDPWPHSARPENLVLLVAGGGHPTNSQWLEGYCPHVVGREIAIPADFDRLLADADRDIGCGDEVCRI